MQSKWIRWGTGLLTASALFLAACGNGEETTETPDQSDDNTGEETVDETETSDDNETSDDTASGETIEITFWHAMNGPHQEAITALTEAFNGSL
ncbi:hypothetical protein GCM10008932_13950 [Alkalibacterium iburiense]|uniref:Carbohydrate ABC transporter substrate-binding protein n=1 Tax=Alkalibacterium iburiense TaxID=290589 RepID=A0ABN0XF62_9LACT